MLQPQGRDILPDGSVRVWAPAKINLNLLVSPRRDDGYHDLDSLVCRIGLYDCIELHPASPGQLSFSCNTNDCGPEEKNLALRAARMLLDHAPNRSGDRPGTRIVLEKCIPPGRGIGGGSSDAATVLTAMNQFCGIGLEQNLLLRIAGHLGSDVPLFLGPPTARMTGRGEILEPVEISDFLIVLVLPEILCPTVAVYHAFDSLPAQAGTQIDTARLAHPPSFWREDLQNHLAEPAMHVADALGDLYRALCEASPIPVHITGSGSGMFMLCDDEEEATRVLSSIPPALRGLCRIVRRNQW